LWRLQDRRLLRYGTGNAPKGGDDMAFEIAIVLTEGSNPTP
jgi:hypothetical protein